LDNEIFEDTFKEFLTSLFENEDEVEKNQLDKVVEEISRITPCSELPFKTLDKTYTPLYYVEQFFNEADLYNFKTHYKPIFLYKLSTSPSLENIFALGIIIHHFPFMKLVLWTSKLQFADLQDNELDIDLEDLQSESLRVVSTFPERFIKEAFPLLNLDKEAFDFKRRFIFHGSYFE